MQATKQSTRQSNSLHREPTWSSMLAWPVHPVPIGHQSTSNGRLIQSCGVSFRLRCIGPEDGLQERMRQLKNGLIVLFIAALCPAEMGTYTSINHSALKQH